VTVAYDNLKRISEDRQNSGKPPLTIKAADKALLGDDLVEMVNAGLMPATVALRPRSELWAEVLPNIQPHQAQPRWRSRRYAGNSEICSGAAHQRERRQSGRYEH